MSKLSALWNKAVLHIKHRAKRIKTYLGVYLMAGIGSMQYLQGTAFYEPFCLSMFVAAFGVIALGGKIPSPSSLFEEDDQK